MAYQLELPDIGEGIVEAEIQKWFVAPGDVVAEDQPLVEVMTDKATVTIPSPKRGKVTRLFWKEGDLAKVHSPLVELELEAGAPAVKPTEPQPSTKPAARGAPEPAAPVAAAPAQDPVRPGSSPSVRPESFDSAASRLRSGQAESRGPARSNGHPAPAASATGRKALAAPAVRALARELDIDINVVAGSGPGGRVTKDDVAAFRDGGRNGHARAPEAPAQRISIPPSEGEERIPFRGVRRKIAENMARSKRTAAHFTFVEQADVTELVKIKHRVTDAAKAEGVKMTYLPFIVKATVAALKKFPQLNAALDEERGEIVRKKHYDIGIASSTQAGLLVPVIRGADRLSLMDLAREIERLASDAKAGRSKPADMGGSTFTITSLGALGGVFATPVINHPEVGILGIHRVRPTPLVKDGQIVARDVMHVSLTSDHRIVDGHEAAAFTYEVIRYLEDPNLLFLHMV